MLFQTHRYPRKCSITITKLELTDNGIWRCPIKFEGFNKTQAKLKIRIKGAGSIFKSVENQFNASGLRNSNSEHSHPDTKSETKSKHAIQVTAHKPMQENDEKKSVSIIETERSGAFRALNDSFEDFESEASDVNENNLDSTTASTKQQQKKYGNTGFKLSIPKAKKEAFYEKTNRTYRFYDDKKKFLEAQKFCEGFSAKLAMLDNELKNKFVMAFTDKPFWIGGRQKGQLWTWIASTKTDGSDCPIIHYKPWAEEGLNRFIQGCIEVTGSLF